jgi:hypothetical protein
MGRPALPAHEKKQREAIYFEPDLLNWLMDEADREMTTVSVIVNRLVAEKKKTNGGC